MADNRVRTSHAERGEAGPTAAPAGFPVRGRFRASIATLIVALLMTFVAWASVQHRLHEESALRFGQTAASLAAEVRLHLQAYDTALRAAEGLYQASHEVEPVEWETFVQGLALSSGRPGFVSMGVLADRPRKQISPWGALAREENRSGTAPFESTSRWNTPIEIVDLEPDGKLERDILAAFLEDPSLSVSLHLSCDESTPGPRSVTRELNRNRTNHIAIFRSVNRSGFADPEAAPGGSRAPSRLDGPNNLWLVTIFEPDTMIAGTLERIDASLHVSLSTRTGDGELWDRAPDDPHTNGGQGPLTAEGAGTPLESVTPISLAGNLWFLQCKAAPEFDGNRGRWLGFCFLAGGILISLLLAGISYGQSATVARARMLASEMTSSLREGEARTRAILDTASDAIITLDQDGRIVDWNGRAETLFGKRREEAIGRAFADLDLLWRADPVEGTVPVPPPLTLLAFPHGRVEAYGRAAGGALFPVELTASSISIAGESLQSLFLRDISEMRAASEALSKRDAILDAVAFTANRLFHCSTWQEGAPEVLEALGRAASVSRVYIFEVVGLDADSLVVSQTYEWVDHGVTVQLNNPACNQVSFQQIGLRRLEETLLRGEVFHGHVRSFTDEERRTLEDQQIESIAIVPIAAAGTLWGFLGFDECREERAWSRAELEALRTAAETLGAAVDRTRAETVLRDSESRFRKILEQIDLVSVILDPSGKVTFCNNAFLGATGWRREEILDRDWSTVFVPESHREEFKRSFLACIEHATFDCRSESELLLFDGRTRTIAWNRTILKDATGRIVGITKIGEDITERKEVAARDAAHLRQIDEARAHAEKQAILLRDQAAQLREARDRAFAGTKAKSEFLANMSHEIRTPMTGIIGMADLLMETPMTGEQREFTGTIRHCAESLLTIINDILDYSKIEAGKMQIESAEFDLRETIERVVEILSPRAQEKGLELNYILPAGLPTHLIGDATRLRQILMNLAGNAIKFTDQGEIAIEISALGTTSEAVQLRIDVRDTGIGIPEDQIQKVFASFNQAESGTTKRRGGTGLGLTISRNLAALMGGEISVTSKIGTGSTFRLEIELPRCPALSSEETDATAVDAGHHVLLVAQNATMRRSIRELLAELGCKTSETESVLEMALILSESTSEEPFDLILADWNLPDIDEVEGVSQIRGDLPSREIPVVAVTRMRDLNSIANGSGAAFRGKLPRPVKLEDLRRLIAALRAEAPAATAAPSETLHAPAPPDASGLRILLVEDNVVNQKVVSKTLEKWGCQIDLARNGPEALDRHQGWRYDLILMDVQLPGMDGYEITRAIRERESAGGDRTPIIAMTAYAMEGDRARCLESGMDDYLAKPLRSVELQEKIFQWGLRVERIERSQPPAPAGEETPSFDLTRLETEYGFDEETVRETFGEFLASASTRIASLQQAVANAEARTIHVEAHALKGTSRMLGADRLGRLCERLEEMGRTGALDGSGQLLEEALEEYESVRSAMVLHLEGRVAA